MTLLIDIGNTRIKWATFAAGQIGEQQAVAYAGWQREDFNNIVAGSVVRPDRVLVGNVGGAAIGALVRDAVRHAWQIDAQFFESTAAAGGVRNAYRDPAKLGVDRWLAVIAAHASEQRAACVVNVGTAMTVDGVDAGGQHLGGLIMPGPALMVDSLLRNTSEIARRAVQGSAANTMFADNTLDAIQQGAVQSLAALVERSVVSMRQRLGESPVLLTAGGARAPLEKLLQIPFKSVPDLVLRGLAALS